MLKVYQGIFHTILRFYLKYHHSLMSSYSLTRQTISDSVIRIIIISGKSWEELLGDKRAE
jgi:hypothetical protein